MDKSKIDLYFTRVNFSAMKYLSLLALGFSLYFLFTDFYYSNIVYNHFLNLYRILDICLAIISSISVIFFLVIKVKKTTIQKYGNIIFLLLYLLWAAVITGIEFNVYGLSTFIIVVLLSTFFIYLELSTSITLFLISFLTLLLTVNYVNGFNKNFSYLLVLLIPTSILSILLTYRNYKNKVTDLQNQEKILDMNNILRNSNEHLEEEVRVRTNEIQIALNKANESDRLKTAFLENMSHEIRTPLNALIGFSKLITNPGLSQEKITKYSNNIETSSRRIIQIVTDLISIAEIQAKQIVNNNSEFDFACLFNEIIDNYKISAKKKNLDFLVFNDLSVKEFPIISDQIKLQLIISHLIDNAIKFTNEGFVEIYLELKDTAIKIKVRDSGVGIPAEMKGVIFQPFRQTEKRTGTKFGGNGLGLTIIKSYIELLNGEINFESESGKGSTFCVSIPIEKKIATKKDEYSSKSKKNKILIVEDEYTNYEFLVELLEEFNLKILHAENGSKAIDIYNENPDILIVLMDIKIPLIDGYEVARLIRDIKKDIVIIAQSAYAKESDKKNLNEIFDYYLEKPLKGMELKNIIKKHLGK